MISNALRRMISADSGVAAAVSCVIPLTFLLFDRQTTDFTQAGGFRSNFLGLRVYTGGSDKQFMTLERVSYTLDSTLDSVNKAEQTAEAVAAKMPFDDEDCHRIAMAVREAAVNAVLHGNAYDPKKKMTVSFENTGESLVIKISDQGRGLNEQDIPDPLAEENLLKQSGRGIFLIRSFMDEVRIRNLEPGTEITLIKHTGHSEGTAREGTQ